MGSESGPEVSMDQAQIQGVVLVILDVNKDISTNALNWALGHVARKGDTLRLVGILSHVLNPMGYKCRVDENSWTGANKKILESELANKRYMLENIQHLDEWCEKAGVQLVIEVKANLHPKVIAVEEARTSGAYHVVLDRTMKKDRKYFIDNLTCFVTRVRNSGGVDSIRSFAISKQLSHGLPKPQTFSSSFTHTLSQTFTSRNTAPLSKVSSVSSSLCGSSVSSMTYNQEYKEINDNLLGFPMKQNSVNSSRNSLSSTSFASRSSSGELFSIDHESANELSLSGPEVSEAIERDTGLKLQPLGVNVERKPTLRQSFEQESAQENHETPTLFFDRSPNHQGKDNRSDPFLVPSAAAHSNTRTHFSIPSHQFA